MKKRRLYTLLVSGTISGFIIHLINKYISYNAKSKDILPVLNRSFFNWKLGRVYYEKYGTGDPVLLIHNAEAGGSGYEWIRISEMLSRNHTLYIVDLPGCGRSDKIRITYTNFVFVQFINNFITRIIKEPCDVVSSGFSSSFVSMAYSYKPDNFKKLFFINPLSIRYFSANANKAYPLLKKIIELPVFGTLIYHFHTSREAVSTRFMNRYYFNPFKADRDIIDAWYEAAHLGGYNSKYFFSSQVSGYTLSDISRSVSLMKNRLCILFGDSYPNADSILSSYLSCNPAVRSYRIGECAYIPHIEKPDDCSRLIEEFI